MKTFRWMKPAGVLLALTLLLGCAAAMVYVTPSPVPTLTPSPVPTLTPMPGAEPAEMADIPTTLEPLVYVTVSPVPTLTPMPPAEPAFTADIPPLPAVDTIGTIAENVVVALNTLAPTPTEPIALYVEPVNPYEIDLESYYANIPNFLLDGEAAQFAKAQKRWDDGERPETSILDLTENVSVGVYALPEEQYQGEKAFLLLPDRELTDEECLQIVDAYAQLGLSFDPANVSWRNCMRGGSIECTRSWAGDEAERFSSLTELYKRSSLRAQTAFTVLPGDDGLGEIPVNPDDYNGLDGFRFWPARRMTDNEILQIVAKWTGDVTLSAGEYAALESQARLCLNQYVGMELSAERTSEGVAVESDFCVWGKDRPMYHAQFRPVAEDHPINAWTAYIDMETNELIHAVSYCTFRPYCDVHEDPFSDKWRSIALNWLSEHRALPVEGVTVECMGEDWLQECGYGASFRVLLADGSSYTLRFHFEDGSLHDAEYSDAIRTASEHAYRMNEFAEYAEEVDQ